MDDMGLFIPVIEHTFRVAREAIGMNELALEAKLNVAKSIIVPFNVLEIPL